MPGCRRTKKVYNSEDAFRPSQYSVARTSENGLRNYGNALDDRTKPVRGSIPESVRDPVYGQRYYSQQRSPQGQNLNIRRELDTNYVR
ncbi:unnamed protein product [Trichobilharzia regenti]|nr:unnamed protein product [Trichobilharzia regenti]